jgi:CRP/FNR family transcriptional regulator, cyclic AMP receptor protein
MSPFSRGSSPTLPLTSYQAGETVLSAASTTGRLLILKEGAVAVVKDGVEIARVTEPGAVFGELSVLLGQPHTADVRALEASQFHVADAATSRSFTLQRSWHSVSTAPTRPSSN